MLKGAVTMVKKYFVMVFSLFFMFLFHVGTASAEESSISDMDSEDFVAELVYEGDQSTEEESIDKISPFLNFTVRHSSLGINKHVKSKNKYKMSKNQKVKVGVITWKPSSQKIQLGFINASNGKQYWTKSYGGGRKTSGSFILSGPSGTYYIAIRTPSTNTRSINVKGSFDF